MCKEMTLTGVILKAASIITMDPANPRAQAISFDTTTGVIAAVGSVADCQAATPGVAVTDLGETILMPGFIEAHSHPILAGLLTQEPVNWIAPSNGYATFAQVAALWTSVNSDAPAGSPVLFYGLDRPTQGVGEPTNTTLDGYFPDRPAVVIDGSGHAVYVNSKVIDALGWPGGKPPADPPGARFGRNPDGTSNGIGYETAAILAMAMPTIKQVVTDPLKSSAAFVHLMASNGITATTDMAYADSMTKGYEALLSVPDAPLRLSVYRSMSDPNANEPLDTSLPAAMLQQLGVKMWADGSPFLGTLAASFPYLDSPVVQKAGIPIGPGSDSNMNWTRKAIDPLLDSFAGTGLQFATHINGDVALDIILDAYERALAVQGLLGTDHRWRIEHCGGARADQLQRAHSMGVVLSLALYQVIYWGDLLDGQLFAADIGSQWARTADAVNAGMRISLHFDGPLSPPIPLTNIQCAVTRMSQSGHVHGPEQIISIDQALRAYTIDAAYGLRREHEIGSLEPGKLADLVELSMDPFLADPDQMAKQIKVLGTWLSGHRVDLDDFLDQVAAVDPSDHPVDHADVIATHTC
jgi:predicted amidohydrolase YtcJ